MRLQMILEVSAEHLASGESAVAGTLREEQKKPCGFDSARGEAKAVRPDQELAACEVAGAHRRETTRLRIQLEVADRRIEPDVDVGRASQLILEQGSDVAVLEARALCPARNERHPIDGKFRSNRAGI